VHEVGLVMQALELAESLTRQHGGKEIHRLVLRVGRSSGVDAEALRLAFEAASPDTLAARATLEIDDVPSICQCAECRCEFSPGQTVFVCPECGAIAADVVSGNDLELATLEFT
jgi:hydrogenase nickel incorporation protein HypA/HybF